MEGDARLVILIAPKTSFNLFFIYFSQEPNPRVIIVLDANAHIL